MCNWFHDDSFYKNLSMQAVRVVLGTAPIIASFFSPLTNIIIVGMLRIPYFEAIEGLSSVFKFKHFSLPTYCLESSPTTGWNIRQGPHHGAQNSTRTGQSASRTRDSHVSSVTVGTPGEVSEASQTMPLGRRKAFGSWRILEGQWIFNPVNLGSKW